MTAYKVPPCIPTYSNTILEIHHDNYLLSDLHALWTNKLKVSGAIFFTVAIF